MNETKVTIAEPTNPAHLPAMHLHNVHMTNQETTVVALFMKDFSSQTHIDLPSLQFKLSINVFSISYTAMMSLAGGKITSFLDKKQWESVTEWRNWDGWQIG